MATLPTVRLDYLPAKLVTGARLYLRPVRLLNGTAAASTLDCGLARALAGGRLAFAACEVLIREPERLLSAVAPLGEVEAWAEGLEADKRARILGTLGSLTAPRTAPGGGALMRPGLMGIVNVTPDSFSDAGAALDPDAAAEQCRRLAEAGASILDIGGESTRPGAEPVDADRELRRVAPVFERLKACRDKVQGALLSIDSRHAPVMRAALALGAEMINDVSALTDDTDSLAVAAGSAATVVLTHGPTCEPKSYAHAALDVFDYLESRIEACVAAGIARERLIVDPGIGFGKRGAHNLQILQALGLYHGLGCPVLLGASRKGLTGAMERRWSPQERLPGTLAAAVHALGQGVQLLRVHDVAAAQQAVAVWERIVGVEA